MKLYLNTSIFGGYLKQNLNYGHGNVLTKYLKASISELLLI
jgi:hypothetical protein